MFENSIYQKSDVVDPIDALEEYVHHEDVDLQDGNLPWNAKGKQKDRVADLMDALGLHHRADKLIQCAQWLKYVVCGKFPFEHPKRLARASFCRDRFCSMCQWRRSLRLAAQHAELLTAVDERYEGHWILLTLTIPNIRVSRDLRRKLKKVKTIDEALPIISEAYLQETNELGEAIDLMNAGWNRMASDRRFKKFVLGFLKVLEITINDDVRSPHYGTYHPHFHVLLYVHKEYFTSEMYTSHDSWTQLWKRCMRLDVDPIVDVRKVKKIETIEEALDAVEVAETTDSPKRSKKQIISAVAEVSKYPLKDANIFRDATYQRLRNGKRRRASEKEAKPEEQKRRLWDLIVALKGKRMLSYGGVIKKMRKELGQVDIESEKADLIGAGSHEDLCKCPVCRADTKLWKVIWDYREQKYYHKGKRP